MSSPRRPVTPQRPRCGLRHMLLWTSMHIWQLDSAAAMHSTACRRHNRPDHPVPFI